MARKTRISKENVQEEVANAVNTASAANAANAAPATCGAWCFILGPAAGTFCGLAPDHEGDHRIQINVYAEPASRFAIYWQLGGPDQPTEG